MRRQGFTLIELLVVIAIIGILIALLLPAVQKVREAANSMACRNNLKQIALACLNYEGTYGTFPAGSVYKSVGGSSNYYDTWTISILPFLEQQTLFALYNPAVPNAIPDASSPPMATLRQTFVKVYACPSDPNPFEPTLPASGPGGSLSTKPLYMPGNYRCVAGADWGGKDWGKDQNGGNENWDDPTQVGWLLQNYGSDRGAIHATNPSAGAGPERIANITDGTSNTLMVGEYATRTELDRRTLWAYAYTSYNESVVSFGQSRTLIADFTLCVNTPPGGDNQCKRAWGSFHGGGNLNFALCDGSVRSVSVNVDMNLVLPALATIAGGETVNLE